MAIIIPESPPPIYDWDESELQALHVALGRALASWGTLEHTLSTWLGIIGRMPYALAKDIFFSVNSFRARLDILGAAISNSRATEENRQFANAAMAKADTYSAARNDLVHGMPFVIIEATGARSVVLARPRGPIEKNANENPITIPQLEAAAKNFVALNRLMLKAHAQEFGNAPNRQRYIELRADLMKQVEQLPNDALSSAPSKRQQGRERQLRAAQRAPIRKGSGGSSG